jgi:hypothetical protein
MLQLLQALSQEWADEVALQHRPGCKNAYQIFSTFGVGIAGRDRSPPASKGSGGRGGKPSPIRFWVGIGSSSRTNFDGSKSRRSVGRPKLDQETERLVVQMARENPSWGYDRIVGALANLGHRLSDQTVGNILRRHGISPAPKRKQTVS